MRSMRNSLTTPLGIRVLLLAAMAAGCRAAREGDESLATVVENVGLETPESVLHDPVADVYLVSNVNGAPLVEDDNGFITRLSPSGEVLELKWIDGAADGVTLNAPKGMALAGETLYVTDISVVRMFDRRSGVPQGEIPVEGATFLNDLATGLDGAVYLTDSGLRAGEDGFVPAGTDGVYRIDANGELDLLASGEELAHPNGVAMDTQGLWVVAYGSDILYRIEDGNMVDQTNLPSGSLDGLVILPDAQMLVSSWEGEAIYRGRAGALFETIISDVPAPADIGYDAERARILIPLFQSNAVQIRSFVEGVVDEEME